MTSLLLGRTCQLSALRLTALRPATRQAFRTFSEDSREQLKTRARRATLRERAMAPPGEGGL